MPARQRGAPSREIVRFRSTKSQDMAGSPQSSSGRPEWFLLDEDVADLEDRVGFELGHIEHKEDLDPFHAVE